MPKVQYIVIHILYVWDLIIKECQRLLGFLCLVPFNYKRALIYQRKLRFQKREVRGTKRRREIEVLRKTLSISPLRDILVQKPPTSDTVFFLGSGLTINEIDDAAWQHIRGKNSIGFNFSLIHEFVPTYYHIEGVGPQERYHCFLNLVHLRAEGYQKVPFIIYYDSWKYSHNQLSDLPPHMRNNVYFNGPTVLYETNPNDVARWLVKWCVKNVTAKAQLDNLPFHSSTISMLLMMARALGYRKMVLCGIDLNSSDFFWEAIPELKKLGPINRQKGVVHETADRSSRERRKALPIDDYIKIVNDTVLKPEKIQLFVSSKNSKLADFLPVYPWP